MPFKLTQILYQSSGVKFKKIDFVAQFYRKEPTLFGITIHSNKYKLL